MVRAPKIDKYGMKKGAWSEEEDAKLKACIIENGYWNWHEVPKHAGLSRCGKSCRLRWVNYLRPNIKLGNYTKEDDDLIIKLHNQLGSRWSAIATNLPGRCDNEIKNRWHAHLKKRAKEQGSRFGKPMWDASSSGSSSRTELSSQSSDCSVLNRSVEDRVATSESFGDTLESFWREPFLTDTDTYTTTTDTFTADYMHFPSPPSPIIGEDFPSSYDIDAFIL